jgi:hypothetical protein
MLKELLLYCALEGEFYILKDDKPYRRLFPDADGYLIFYKKGKKYKIKANKLAVELGNDLRVPKEKVVLHKNLDTSDYRLQNLSLVTRKAFNSVKEAQRNLSSYLKLVPHSQDVFSYVLNWREEGKDRVLVVQDIVIARRMFNKLQLKYAKILSKYCVFD